MQRMSLIDHLVMKDILMDFASGERRKDTGSTKNGEEDEGGSHAFQEKGVRVGGDLCVSDVDSKY